jgi:G3E family GTPase
LTPPAANVEPRRNRLPVILLTGFLGSGKTTLLTRLLAHPGMRDSAVLINELGETGLDQQLVWNAGGASTTLLENGCLCCSLRQDFAATLEDLFWARLHRRIPRFERLLVETTGLADPLPLIELLAGEPLLAERYRLARIIATVDASVPPERLERYPESLSQLALADTVVLAKADLAGAPAIDAWETYLGAINPAARLHRVAMGDIAPEVLFSDGRAENEAHASPARDGDRAALARRTAEALVTRMEVRRAAARTAVASDEGALLSGAIGPALHQRVRTFSLVIEQTLAWQPLERALLELLSTFGASILRVKGIVRLQGEAHPQVVQIAGGRLFAPRPLPAGLAGMSKPFLVFIVDGLEPGAVRAALAGTLPAAQKD